MTIQTIAEQAILWYKAYLMAGKGEHDAERMAMKQVQERYGADWQVTPILKTILDTCCECDLATVGFVNDLPYCDEHYKARLKECSWRKPMTTSDAIASATEEFHVAEPEDKPEPPEPRHADQPSSG